MLKTKYGMKTIIYFKLLTLCDTKLFGAANYKFAIESVVEGDILS